MSQRTEDDPSLRGSEDQDYVHIREPRQDGMQVSDPQREINIFLQPFEEGLRGDAAFYTLHTELLSRVEREWHFWESERPIKRIQFWTNEDMYTFWAVEMALEKLQNSTVKAPRTTTFVRLARNDSNVQQLEEIWASSDQFLHPYTLPHPGGGNTYDPDNLREGIVSHTQISMDQVGKIKHISVRSRDEAVGANSFLEVALDRNEHPTPPAIITSSSRLLIEQMLKPLPLERLRHQAPPK